MITILIMIALPSVGTANTQERLWAVGLTSGGDTNATYEEFYQASKYFYSAAASFGVPVEHSMHFFGSIGPDGKGQRAYSRPAMSEAVTQEMAKTLARLATALGQIDCRAFPPSIPDQQNWERGYEKDQEWLINLISTHQGREVVIQNPDGSSLSDLTGGGGDDFSGYATKENLLQSLNTVAKNAHSGDHLLLQVAGHGLKDSENSAPVWKVVLRNNAAGEPTEVITDEEFKPILRSLEAKGVEVHLTVEACYSGGFTRLTDFTPSGGTCVATVAAKDTPGLAGKDKIFPNLSKNALSQGSQLKSFACGIASDQVNEPITSLDEVIERANAQKSGIASIANPETPEFSRLRQGLIEAYKSSFVATYQSCLPSDVVGQSQAIAENPTLRLVDAALANMDQCKKVTPPDDYNWNGDLVLNVLKAFSKNLHVSPRSGPSFAIQMIARHLGFLENADRDGLTAFKRAFCCLDFDPRSGVSPSVCAH